MKALIDLDPLVYQYGSCSDQDGNTLPPSVVHRHVMSKIEDITEKAGCDSWKGYLTFGPDNFRFKVATIKPYKGNRKDKEKPPLYDSIRGFLSDLPNVHMAMGMEADDRVSIDQWEEWSRAESLYHSYIEDDQEEEELLGSFEECDWMHHTVICTIDKDLDNTPGWHYRWESGNVKEKARYWVSTVDSWSNFFGQCLTGDPVDSIPGLRGVGGSSRSLDHIRAEADPADKLEIVHKMYTDWYGSYADMFLDEVAKLLWMLRTDNVEETFRDYL